MLDRRLAVGGMGEVWEAFDPVLHRRVAVKLLRDDLTAAPRSRERFHVEARHAAALNHPSVAAVHDYGEEVGADGRVVAYLVMELVRAPTLAEVLARRGALALPTAMSIVAQTADALAAAHELGIVHRDVKPGNLMILGDDTVKVTDFGISRAVDGIDLTLHGQVLGTPVYLSPEQAVGHRATPASDLYSLGVVAYEMLAGRPPFTGTRPDVIVAAHLRELPPPLPRSAALAAPLVDQLLAKDPADRPTDARTVAAAARELGRDLGDTSAPAPVAPSAGPVPPGPLPTIAVIEAGQAAPDGPTEVLMPTAVMPGAFAMAPPAPRRGLVLLLVAGALALGGALWLRDRGPADPLSPTATVAPTATTAPTPTTVVDSTVVAPAVTGASSTEPSPTTAAPVTTHGKPGKGHGKPKG